MICKCTLANSRGLIIRNEFAQPLPIYNFTYQIIINDKKYKLDIDLNVFDNNYNINRDDCDYAIFDAQLLNLVSRDGQRYIKFYNWLTDIYISTKKKMLQCDNSVWDEQTIEI